MVVLTTQDGRWLVIRQTDHAAFSGALAGAWLPPRTIHPDVWRRLTAMVAHHDDGWREVDAEPTVDGEGRPHDFITLPTARHLGVWRRSMERAAQRDIFAGLMVAHHARSVQTRFGRETDPADIRQAQVFLNEATLCIDRHLHQLAGGAPEDRAAVEPGTLAAATALLGLFDYLSLALLGAVPWQGRTEPVHFGAQRSALQLQRPTSPGHVAGVKPWPFAGASVEHELEARELPARKWADAKSLHQALQTAPRTKLTLRLTPVQGS